MPEVDDVVERVAAVLKPNLFRAFPNGQSRAHAEARAMARAAIEALAQSPAIDPRVEELVEAATTAKRALEIVNETLQRMEGVTSACTAEVVRRLDTALAPFGGKAE